MHRSVSNRCHIVGLITLLIREHAAQLIALIEHYAMIAASSVRWQTEGPKCHAPSPIRSTLRPRRHAAPRECRYHRQFDVAADIGNSHLSIAPMRNNHIRGALSTARRPNIPPSNPPLFRAMPAGRPPALSQYFLNPRNSHRTLKSELRNNLPSR